MGITHLWDTNVVIYYLQQQFPPATESFIDDLLTTSLPAISVITEIELLCWKTENESDINLLKNFIQDALVIELEAPVKLKTAEIRKSTRLKLPDAIIAATAIVSNLTLLTRTSHDFEKIANLKMINPWNP
jgi:predicted nucleic acid-binding protein